MSWSIIIGIAISCFRTRPHTYIIKGDHPNRKGLIWFNLKRRDRHIVFQINCGFLWKRGFEASTSLLAPFLNHHTSCIQVSTVVVAVLLSSILHTGWLIYFAWKKNIWHKKSWFARTVPFWKMNNSVTTIRGTASFFSRFQTHYYSVVTYLWKLRTFLIYL